LIVGNRVKSVLLSEFDSIPNRSGSSLANYNHSLGSLLGIY